MAAGRERKDHGSGTHPPYEFHNRPAALLRVEDAGVGHSRVDAFGDAHHLRRLLGFAGSGFGVSQSCRLAGCEVDDAGTVAGSLRLDQRPGAGEFHVVPVGGDGEKIDRLHGEGR